MSGFLTWQALVLLLVGILFGSQIRSAFNRAKSKV